VLVVLVADEAVSCCDLCQTMLRKSDAVGDADVVSVRLLLNNVADAIVHFAGLAAGGGEVVVAAVHLIVDGDFQAGDGRCIVVEEGVAEEAAEVGGLDLAVGNYVGGRDRDALVEVVGVVAGEAHVALGVADQVEAELGVDRVAGLSVVAQVVAEFADITLVVIRIVEAVVD